MDKYTNEGKGTLSLSVGCQLTDTSGMMELGNHQWRPKLVGEVAMRDRIHIFT